MAEFLLVERVKGVRGDAGLFHAERRDFPGDLEAERWQSERWNRFHSVGEPRVRSRLYREGSGTAHVEIS